MGLLTEKGFSTKPGLLSEPAWLAPALNGGFAYSDRIAPRAFGQSVSAFYADCLAGLQDRVLRRVV